MSLQRSTPGSMSSLPKVGVGVGCNNLTMSGGGGLGLELGEKGGKGVDEAPFIGFKGRMGVAKLPRVDFTTNEGRNKLFATLV
jgi:hypothetical protein